MKTLVVLSALVSLAIAAPALPGEGLEDKTRIQDWHIQGQSSLPDPVKREKKSTSDITTTLHDTGVATTEDHHAHHIDSTHTARSFALKKPLIVKNKYGYRLYRDSEEEKAHADSNETCGRQVRVKLCDEDKFKNAARSSTHETIDDSMAEDDVKESIKMAKEAVENLQRDLKKMEQTTTMKMAHESNTDTELHEDIEVARQALEHIHENFGSLESMSLHATASRDSDIMQDVHLTIAKTEEQRMAQWKEAMANIQKNVEIVRNIEDSFKTANLQENLGHFEDLEATTAHKLEENANSHALLSHDSQMRASEIDHMKLHHHKLEENVDSHLSLPHDSLMRTSEIEELKVHHKNIEEKPLNMETKEHLSELVARQEQNVDDDMKPAASGVVETQLDEIKGQESLRSEGHDDIEHKDYHANSEVKNLENKENTLVHHLQKKNSDVDMDMDMLTGPSEHHISQVPLMKTVEDETEMKLNMEKDTPFKSAENIPEVQKVINLDTHVTSGHIVPLTSDALHEHQREVELKDSVDKTGQALQHEKSAWDTKDDMLDFLAKSAQYETNLKPENVIETLEVKPKEAAQSLHDEIKQEEKLDHMHKSAEQLDLTNLNNTPDLNENFMMEKSAGAPSVQDLTKQHINEEKIFDPQATRKGPEEHLHHLEHMHNGHKHHVHKAHEHRHLDHLSSMKAAEEHKKDFELPQGHGHGIIPEKMDHLRYSHLVEHGHIPNEMRPYDHEFSSHQIQHHPHFPTKFHNSMPHSHMHEMSGPIHSDFHHSSMRDAMEGLGSDHMFRWKPSHESARGAYGSGLSGSIGGSGGAVGVFPNANTGGCGIPLLLSCSPSVVSGSLAKPSHGYGGSYSSPAYRSEDEFNFHNKRDVKKTSDLRTTNGLRSQAIVKQKSPALVESKQ